MSESKNRFLLRDFTDYCIKHPEERFWQALRNWIGVSALFVGHIELERPVDQMGRKCIGNLTRVVDADTFYWEGKNG